MSLPFPLILPQKENLCLWLCAVQAFEIWCIGIKGLEKMCLTK